ncbi:unnamed protein product [Peronospora belbahrii]|uniref:CCHC-type domain-containing protein n=1 Tax=Peronospora belbahrii TaxID=622444 RepID=A0ABN8D630_9STRA|nr:unnamed protein product [Peronospora belbahrii]CAH0520396.1 unnamed protein product [Peronospora belbahrii]
MVIDPMPEAVIVTVFIQVEDEEAELQAAEQQIVRRCYICKSTGHLMSKCPARKLIWPRRANAPWVNLLVCREETAEPSRRGAIYWGKTEFC